MSASDDLINFDLIETHKENIQPLPSGRSAKALLDTFAPRSLTQSSTPNATRNLNDSIREEYELELTSAQDLDDPLDVYDRYLKWTLSAYPSAQATPDAQLRQLLERATKTFQAVSHYKNDPRYVKMWLHYIRLFSDAPKEAFAYLSRHGIGEGLALFYEDFAAWLENADRWKQADEVFQMGIEREARPTERLIRKYEEFQARSKTRAALHDEPSSPALSTVRPALAAKVDPFSSSTVSTNVDQQASQATQRSAKVGSRSNKQKLAIFSDAKETHKVQSQFESVPTKGWDHIGTATERKKENIVEAKPWTGERLKTTRKAANTPKMAVYKDDIKKTHLQSDKFHSNEHPRANAQRSSALERVFVNLHAVYPVGNETELELSFEELRAGRRGWLTKDWRSAPLCNKSAEMSPSCLGQPILKPELSASRASILTAVRDEARPPSPPSNGNLETTIALDIEGRTKGFRTQRTGFKEIKGLTQTIKINLESPTGPKLKRRQSVEPTMTLHTKAATEDILDIFSQPLRAHDPMLGSDESEAETDAEDDEDYTSAGESTGTGRISTTGEFADTIGSSRTTATNGGSAEESVSPWSDFSTKRHVPSFEKDATSPCSANKLPGSRSPNTPMEQSLSPRGDAETPGLEPASTSKPLFEPTLAENHYSAPTSQRDPAAAAPSRLPFMTPILEKTETSMSCPRILETEDTTSNMTPSRLVVTKSASASFGFDVPSSPLEVLFTQEKSIRGTDFKGTAPNDTSGSEAAVQIGPIIQDSRCNPVDDNIRQCILGAFATSFEAMPQYHAHNRHQFSKGPDIRRYVKSIAKSKSFERTLTTHLPPVLNFPGDSLHSFTIRRELGKGAYAPVYLAEQRSTTDTQSSHSDPTLVAIKAEHPPTAWEFYIMTVLQARLPCDHRDRTSFLRPRAMHLFQDEGYLLEEYRDQGTLLDLVNLARSDPISGQTTLDESVTMYFAVELLRVVGSMHEVGILHGDLKADNCLVRLDHVGLDETGWSSQFQTDGSAGWSSKGITLIDFGRSIDLTQFRADVSFIADWKTGKQDCIEMRELRPWTYQVDYFGMAGIVHSLLFGKYIEDIVLEPGNNAEDVAMPGERQRYRIREGLKRYWQTELWSRFFELTLNPLYNVEGEANRKMPISNALRALQHNMEHWLAGEGGRRNGSLKTNLMKLETRIRERRGR